MSDPSALAPGGPQNADELAEEIDKLKVAVIGLSIATPPLLDPSLPLLQVYIERYGQTPTSPLEVRRQDGSLYSDEPLSTWLQRAASGGGPAIGLGREVISVPMIYITTYLGDLVDDLGLRDKQVPLMEFLRHLRNACAHGNRWHFQGSEPKQTAACRALVLGKELHGTRAIWGSLGPAEYLDFLDDLATHFRALSNPP